VYFYGGQLYYWIIRASILSQ